MIKYIFWIITFSSVPINVFAKVTVKWLNVSNNEDKIEYQNFVKNNFNEKYSPQDISEFIKLSHQRYPVEKIIVEKTTNGFTLKVKQKVFLNQVNFKGYKNISKKRLFEASQFVGGKYYSEYEIDNMVKNIKNYYRERSFWNVAVDYELLTNQQKKNNAIDFVLLEGVSCRVRSIQFNYLSEQRLPKNLLKKIPVNKGVLCDELKIKDKLRRYDQKIRSYGYRQFDFQNIRLDFDAEKKNADLVLDVDVGKLVEIKFKGNTFVFERGSVLLEQLSMQSEKVFGETWSKFTAVPAIKDFYTALGYPFTKVIVYRNETEKKLEILFDITRGDRFFIDDISFKELNHKSFINLEKVFKAYSLTQSRRNIFVKDEFEQSVDSMISFYQNKGFIRTLVDDIDYNYNLSSRSVNIITKFNVSERSFFKKFTYIGNTVFTNNQLDKKMNFKIDEAISPLKLSEQVELLINEYRVLGYKNVSIDYPKINDISEGYNQIALNIKEGNKIFIGKVKIEGNQTTKERIINKNLDFKEGDVLNPDKIRSSRRNLLQSGFFESVFIDTQSKPINQLQDVVVRLKERKKRSVILSPGFSTDDGVRARVEYRHVNIGGTGRQLNLLTRFNRKFNDRTTTERRLGITYIEPFIYGRTNASLSFLNERVDDQQFDLERNLFRVGIENAFLQRLRPRFNWILEFREPFNVEEGASLNPIDEQAARFGSLVLETDLDLRDDFLNPIKGTYHQFKFELYDKAFLSEQEFWKLYIKNNFYWPIYKRVRTVLSVRLGFSETYGDTVEENIPIEKRFRIGGSSSFRGARFNCIGGVTNGDPENCSDNLTNQAPGGNSMFNYLFEVLVPITESIDIALFTDGGNAYLTNNEFDVFNIRTAAGAGIRLNTFFGPMRFDYGVLLDRRAGENLGTFHFSVGQF
ncbi:MAG TPA: BamA/TamA family outer membrane protein [Oligoflexia bacterium]|nr:BamA/TamA family outer membrane protein [Oligoflexia bacterium]